MPLFDYACKKCQHEFEALVDSTDESVDCPECNSSRTLRQLSVPAKPGANGASMSMSCNTDAPPCRPGCCRM